ARPRPRSVRKPPRARAHARATRSARPRAQIPPSPAGSRRARQTILQRRGRLCRRHALDRASFPYPRQPLLADLARVLHLALDGPLADAERLRDRVVALLVGRAHQKHLPAAGLQIPQRALDRIEPLLEVDDALRILVPSLLDAVLAFLAHPLAPAEFIVREVRCDLEQIGARTRR